MNKVLDWFKIAAEPNGDPEKIEWRIKKDDYLHKAVRGYQIIEVGSKINHTPTNRSIENPPDPSLVSTHRWKEFVILPNGREITPIRQFFDMEYANSNLSFKEISEHGSDITVSMFLDVLRKSLSESDDRASELLISLNRSYGMEAIHKECNALIEEILSPQKQYPAHYVHGLKFTIDDVMLAKEKIKRKHPKVLPLLLISGPTLADLMNDPDFDKHLMAYKMKMRIPDFPNEPPILTHSVLETICGMHIVITPFISKDRAVMMLPFISCKIITDPEMLLSAERIDADRFNDARIIISGLHHTKIQIKDRDTILVMNKT